MYIFVIEYLCQDADHSFFSFFLSQKFENNKMYIFVIEYRKTPQLRTAFLTSDIYSFRLFAATMKYLIQLEQKQKRQCQIHLNGYHSHKKCLLLFIIHIQSQTLKKENKIIIFSQVSKLSVRCNAYERKSTTNISSWQYNYLSVHGVHFRDENVMCSHWELTLSKDSFSDTCIPNFGHVRSLGSVKGNTWEGWGSKMSSG